MYRLGIDVGGTFTDYVAVDEQSRFVSGKTPSTPGAESVAVLDAVNRIAHGYSVSVEEFLSNTEVINFGTTVATNAMLEHKGAPTGMITTKGFRDVVELRRGYKESLFDIRLSPPAPIVRRRHRKGVTERIDFEGKIRVPLNEDEVRVAVESMKGEGIVSYAVCLLQAPVNPEHERRCADIIQEVHPEGFVTLSSDVLNQIGEFERFSTTIVNAYLSPVLSDYMADLGVSLAERGFRQRLLIMQSNGGTSTVSDISSHGVSAVLSGPAGGVVAATHVGAASGSNNLIGVDMGGTSYDVSLIRGGRPEVRMDAWTARYRLGLPILDIHSIGAGGGSIAWIDPGGALRVGPQSAGANPGPACYRRGGDQPTVTDANLILGYLSSANFVSGEMTLHKDAAEKAIDKHVAEPLGLSLINAAIGIYRIVNNNMSNGIRFISVARGHDPRDFSLLAFGGAAPTHAQVQARDLGIRTILVPKAAGVLSGYGALISDLKVSAMGPFLRDAHSVDLEDANRIWAELWKKHRGAVSAADVEHIDRLYLADFRYQGQVHELTVPVTHENGVVTEADWSTAIASFHKLHEQLYTFQLPDKPVEVITLRQDLLGVRSKPPWQIDAPAPLRSEEECVKERRLVCMPSVGPDFHFVETPIYAGERLFPGHAVTGPAVIEESNTTIVLFPGDRAELNDFGTYVIAVGSESG